MKSEARIRALLLKLKKYETNRSETIRVLKWVLEEEFDPID